MIRWPIFSLGFRPFFILGAVWSCIITLAWSLSLCGIAFTGFLVSDHVYEMIYGFSGAIVVGFLLTATQNWTKTRGVHGLPLIILCLLWLAARAFALLQINFYKLTFDFFFYAYFIYLIAPYLLQQNQKRNWIIFIVLLLFLFNLSIPLMGIDFDQSLYMSFTGLLLLVYMISNRVIPFFTKNSMVVDSLSIPVWVEKSSLVLFFSWLVLLFTPTSLSIYSSPLAAICLILTGFKVKRWPWSKVIEVPILAALYMSYFWLVLALFMDVINIFPTIEIKRSVIAHALSFGYLGGMVLSLISRVSLSHTGRKLEASTAITISYFVFHLGAIIRVFGVLLTIDTTLIYTVSSMFWSMSFIIFLFEYIPYLVKPGVDENLS